eukprot:jgi/Ulvmu1/983/UM103_0010.1
MLRQRLRATEAKALLLALPLRLGSVGLPMLREDVAEVALMSSTGQAEADLQVRSDAHHPLHSACGEALR